MSAPASTPARLGAALFANNVFNKQAYLENMTELTLTNASFNR